MVAMEYKTECNIEGSVGKIVESGSAKIVISALL
jgi:hypothetical protein